MSDDERQIRNLVAVWMESTKSGDLDRVMELMTDDVVFLSPGRPPMTKADFAKGAEAQKKPGGPKFDGKSEIQELKILGDWAFLWSKLDVVGQMPDGEVQRRSGHTLTLFRKEAGQWRLARDANLLAPVAK